MRKPRKEIQWTTYDDLLGNNSTGAEEGELMVIPLSELYPFKNHPFQVKDDEKMAEMAESIRRYGVLNPGIVRVRAEGGYELIAGHRRKRGCELSGKDTMPVFVRDYSDDEAVIIMIDSNIQREDILPSEKAFAYKMKLEAMKHQGIKTDEQSDCETADLVGKEAGDSGRKVQRYIRLTELIPDLLQLVDDGKVKFIPAVSLSYLSNEEQNWVLRCMMQKKVPVSGSMADALKKYSMEGTLSELAVELILCEEKKDTGKVSLPRKKVMQYFPETYTKRQIEETIFELLENWKNEQ